METELKLYFATERLEAIQINRVETVETLCNFFNSTSRFTRLT
jgi:hypothetical protein